MPLLKFRGIESPQRISRNRAGGIRTPNCSNPLSCDNSINVSQHGFHWVSLVFHMFSWWFRSDLILRGFFVNWISAASAEGVTGAEKSHTVVCEFLPLSMVGVGYSLENMAALGDHFSSRHALDLHTPPEAVFFRASGSRVALDFFAKSRTWASPE